MFKDPTFLALLSYLAGHAVQYLTTRTLHIPAAVVAKDPTLGTVNDLTSVVGAIAQTAVASEIANQLPAAVAAAPATASISTVTPIPPASGS